MARPQPADFPTRAHYRWARRQYLRQHGGSMFGSIAIATFFGLASGSQWVLFGLLAYAVVAHAIARSRP